MTMPPVNSTPRCRPRVIRNSTASTNVTAEITLNTSACRMKGISRSMRKNSMSRFLKCVRATGLRGPGCALVPAHVADRQALQPLARAEDEIDDGTRYHHRAEHRSHDAQHVNHGEAAHRAGAE